MKNRRDLLDSSARHEALVLCVIAVVFLTGTQKVYDSLFFLVAVLMILRTLCSGFHTHEKVALCVGYIVLYKVQTVYTISTIFEKSHHPAVYWTLRAVGVLMLLLPLFVERFVTANKSASFYLPSVEEVQTISFGYLRENKDRLIRTIGDVERTAGKLTPGNLSEVFINTAGHSSTHYVNQGNLTDEFFAHAAQAMDDPWMYIIISDTGSAASELIGSFTKRMYNHASLAFDRQLDTILSYNGGQNIYPPGMNAEMVSHFYQKSDASVLVYRIAASRQQKETILATIRKINEEGSAYNRMGLVTKKSYKPNIMFCSQFVYRMLQEAGLTYFEKQPGQVRPTDFVEMDYHRKLEFVEEIRFC